ncbi:hypothetical protein [Microbacterium esteraromaticum]|uniref:hypothetical protein n=1 Tax=Microbacterium esteraromaticum TaxID=57043 RepID=UPI0019D40D6E|nr:hypothetical protein [Microbacterium esteraromaticum]MBN7793782.1 hypothetical protein [Microbacterium esteraromaticum]
MQQQRLLEVWGDTVDSRHLLGAIGLGVGIAVPVYLFAEWGFAELTDGDAVGRSYALVTGLAACIVAAVIAANIFKPKRVVTIGAAAAGGREDAMDAIEAELGPLGNPDELPAAALAEVKELGLYDDLLAQHRKNQARQEAAR